MESNLITKNYTIIGRLKKFFKFLKRNEKNNTSIIQSSYLKLTRVEVEEICSDDYVIQLFSKLKVYEKYVSVYLHGSWADGTKTSFSDLDDFVILDVEALKRDGLLSKVCKKLNRIDIRFCRIDPIQHHGHWICTTEDLNNYDNSFMPLHIFNDAKIILGNKVIRAKINSELTLNGLSRNIKNTCNGIKWLSEIYFAGAINTYQLKGLVGSIALMPSFVMQISGNNYSKPRSIQLADSIYSKEAIKCIRWATDCRNNWNVITDKSGYKVYRILPYLFLNPFLWRKFSGIFSPKVAKSDMAKLSEIKLEVENINLFIKESLKYEKHGI